MQLLNVGCGSVRNPDPWINLDELHAQLRPGSPERINLDKEPNYVDHKLPEIMPFKEGTFDGVLCSHVIEHFDCQDAVKILEDCRRVLKIGGLLVVTVPDAEYFRMVYDRDKPESATGLFGEPICPDEPWHKSFFDYALFYKQHKQVITDTVLWCLLVKAGFKPAWLYKVYPDESLNIYKEIAKLLNRRMFSLEIGAVK